jgi:hypothetical protein
LSALIGSGIDADKLSSGEHHRPADVRGHPGRHQSERSEIHHGLAAPALADDSQRFAAVDRVAHPIDGPHWGSGGQEIDCQIPDVEDTFAGH